MPESRLKEQFFGASSANTSFGDEPAQGERKVCFILCGINLSPLFGFSKYTLHENKLKYFNCNDN